MASVTPLSGDGPDLDAIVTDLHQRYALQIYQFCRHQLSSREEAEDATQQTFIQALRGLERGASLDSESGWLFTIARNVCLNSKRSAFRRRRIETPSTLYEFQEGRASMTREPFALHGLVDALEDLPPIQRRAILLREWQGLSYAEIASDLGLSQAAVETLLFRARRTVAARLSDGPKRTASSRIGEVGSLLTALKGLMAGAVPKLAVTATTVVAASAVGASVEAVPAASSTGHFRPAGTYLTAQVSRKDPLSVAQDLPPATRSTRLPGTRGEEPAERAYVTVLSTEDPEPPVVQSIVSVGEGSQAPDDQPPVSAADDEATNQQSPSAEGDRPQPPSASAAGPQPSSTTSVPAPASPAAAAASAASAMVTTPDAVAPATSPAPAGQDPTTHPDVVAATPPRTPAGTGNASSAPRNPARAVLGSDEPPAGAPGAARSASAKADADAKRPPRPDTLSATATDAGTSAAHAELSAARARDPSVVAAGQAAVVVVPAKGDPPETSPGSSDTSGVDSGTTSGRSIPPVAAGPPTAMSAAPPTAPAPGPPGAASVDPTTAPPEGPPAAPSVASSAAAVTAPSADPRTAPSAGPSGSAGEGPVAHAQ